MTALRFRDRMRGPVGLGSREPNDGARRGRLRRSRLAFDVAIAIEDVDAFLRDPQHVARVTGHVDCEELGGRLKVTLGTFNLFRDADADRTMRMRYRLFLRDDAGRDATLSGFKDIVDDPGADAWRDATTLLVRVLGGHVDEATERDAPAAARLTVAAGILRISAPGFLALLASMRASGGTRPARLRARWRFAALFLGRLRSVFRGVPSHGHQADFPDPFVPGAEPFAGYPPGTWHHPPELDGLERRILPLRALDGRDLTLHQVRGPRPPSRGPVLLIHGSGVRANLFYGPPGRPSFVRALVDAGYDVWLENWRASIDLGIRPYTLDEAARYDHPVAMDAVLEHTGARSLKVLCHCQGSTSFVITALAGLAPNVTRVVSSAVSLHPMVPWASRLKLTFLRPVLAWLTPIVSAQWGVRPPTPLGWLVARWAGLVRRECHDPVCALANYMYGAGGDVLWRHANLDDETHDWTAREFGYAPMSFVRQMARSVRAGHLVPVQRVPGLPASYVDAPLPDETPWTFVAGDRNRLFTADSQRRTHAWFAERQPGLHELTILDGYGHLDLFYARDAQARAFPALLAALEG
jgi:hypothetical protein